jgi:hypothetical protein
MKGRLWFDRGVFHHPFFEGEEYSNREAWFWMLARACWQDHDDLKRGEFFASQRYLAEKFRWSRPRVQRFIKRLESERMVHYFADPQTDPGAARITICNYGKFQDAPVTADPPSDPKRIKTGSTISRASSLKEDYEPQKETREWAAQQRPDLDLDDTLDNFKNYHIAKGTRYKVWDLAFKNWVKRERPNGQRTHGSQPQQPRSPEDVVKSRRQKADRVFGAFGLESPWDGPGDPEGDAEPTVNGISREDAERQLDIIDLCRDRGGVFQADPDVSVRKS